MRKFFSLVTALIVGATMTAHAYDFSAACSSGQTLYYTIVDGGLQTCEVADPYPNSRPTGDVTIDATVVNPDDSKTYTVLGVGDYGFDGASEMTSVTLPTAATFTYINRYGFYSTGLTSITIPDNITTLGYSVFRSSDLQSVTIGSGVTAIPNSCFNECKSLERVVFPNTITEFGPNIFAGSAVKYVELGNAVTSVYANTFGSNYYYSYKTSIDTIVIHTTTPPTVKAYDNGYGIYDTDFYDELIGRCIVYVPSTAVSTYKSDARWGKFKYIYAEGTPVEFCIVTLDNHNQNYLENGCVYIDGSSTALGDRATFKRLADETFTVQIRCENNRYYGIDSVTLGGVNVTDQFDATGKATLSVSADAELDVTYKQVIQPYDFVEKISTGQKLYFKITDAVNNKAKIVNQTGGRSMSGFASYSYYPDELAPQGDMIIPTSITHDAVTYTIEEIDSLAFRSCGDITSLTIPEGIKAIRMAAFEGLYQLKGDLYIPNSCTVLEDMAFQNIGLPGGTIYPGGVKTLKYETFQEVDAVALKASSAMDSVLNYVFGNYWSNNDLKTIELGENVKFVSSYAFAKCYALETVTLYATTPPDVKERGDSYPATNWGYFDPSTVTLYVPKGTKSAYSAHDCWKLFTIEELPTQYTTTTAYEGGLGGVSGGGRYNNGTDTVITANPAPHYMFVKWKEDNSTDNPRSITVDADKTYTAVFAPKPAQVGDILEKEDYGQVIRYEVISVSPKEVKLISNGNYYNDLPKDWTIPATVNDYWDETFQLTRLGYECMENNDDIDTLRIPEGVRVIEERALFGSQFKKWVFPSTIDSIYDLNDTYNYKLEDIQFAGTDHLRYINFYYIASDKYNNYKIMVNAPDNAFFVRDGVALFYKGTPSAIYEVPEGVKVIAKRAGYYPSLSAVRYVRLPSTLKVLGDMAFADLPYQCTTVYIAASNPPLTGSDIFNHPTTMNVIIPCDANLTAYQADGYWGTLASVRKGSQFIPMITADSDQGSFEITETTCGTIHIAANPKQYFVVDKWSTGATTDAIDVVLTQDTAITLEFKYESYTVQFLDWDGSVVSPAQTVQRHGYADVPALPNNRYGYTSDKWTRSDGNSVGYKIVGNVDFTVHYQPNTYTITFKNFNGIALDSHTQKYDEDVYYYSYTPTRSATDTCYYYFDKWDPEFVSGTTTVTGDMTFIAQFTKTYKNYTVTYKNWNGDVLETKENMHLGDVLTYGGTTPTKPSTDQYEYEFTGWNNSYVDGVTQVSKSVSSYVAQFTQKTRKYTVKFVDEDGTSVLWSKDYEYGSTPSYKDGAETPAKAADMTYTYAFDKWTPAIATVIGEATYKVSYTPTYIDYTVTFTDYDDSEIAKQEGKHYGDVITYTAVPTRDADVQYIYTFDKWTPDFVSGTTAVTGNMTFKATYTTKTQKYTVTFLEQEGGTKMDDAIVAYGSDATSVAPDLTAITPLDKRFDSWSQDITNVQGNMTVWPTWKDKIYTVKFIDPLDGDKVIDEYENVSHGGKVAPPTAPEHAGYDFKGWDSEDYKNVTDDLIIKAVYESTPTDIENQQSQPANHKFIKDGQLYILRDGKTYNAQGAKVE